MTWRNTRQKISAGFLVIFSLGTLLVSGVIWACAWYEEEDASVFTPEYFVDKQYSPFFYDGSNTYYGNEWNASEESRYNNNARYNEQVVAEWDGYLQQGLPKAALIDLLFTVSRGGIDSINRKMAGKLVVLPAGYPDVMTFKGDKKLLQSLLNYLLIAKDCETFAVREEWREWEDKPVVKVNATLEMVIRTALEQAKDDFIKQRLLFQLTRYYYFQDKFATSAGTMKTMAVDNSKIVMLVKKYESALPKNLIYYRTLGYLAGYYYYHGDYALSNYLYSQGYNYSLEMKIPSKWSFHPQEEADWKNTLALARNKEEQITLWHMLGMEYDPARAIKEITALDPAAEKAELLLSRLINIRENGGDSSTADLQIIDAVAKGNKTPKPYYWSLGAGYLHYLHSDYKAAAGFYATAQKQMPANNRYLQAQYRLLNILLYIDQAVKLDSRTETRLTEHLTWLADLRDKKDTVGALRFNYAVTHAAAVLAKRYKQQGDVVKAVCFNNETEFYTNNSNIIALQQLMNKPDKTAYEKVMLRYYPLKVEDLYYHQATLAAYRENLDEAIELMQKAGEKATFELAGNPFNGRLNDCHDCDHEAAQKTKYTALSLLTTMKKTKAEMDAGRDVYRNALLLANAYYNITYFGNARLFYETEIITGSSDAAGLNEAFRPVLTSCTVAEKYYQLALKGAANNEQRARCTFMAAKCERNTFYNWLDTQPDSARGTYDNPVLPPAGKYFRALKANYAQSAYYKEVLKECGYFRSYVNSGK